MMKLKETKYKMSKSEYKKFPPQKYLRKFDLKKAQMIFKFIVGMEKFVGNFKGRGPPELCPLCCSHYDLQELSVKCPAVVAKVGPTGNYEDIFQPNIPGNVLGFIQEIIKLRNKQE